MFQVLSSLFTFSFKLPVPDHTENVDKTLHKSTNRQGEPFKKHFNDYQRQLTVKFKLSRKLFYIINSRVSRV